MEKDNLNTQVLLEISLNQRIDGDIESSIGAILLLYQRKLNCIAAALFKGHDLLKAQPQAMLNDENWLEQANQFTSKVDLQSRQPLYEYRQNAHWYALPLNKFGFLVLMRERELSSEMIKELNRVAFQLARDLSQAKEEERLRLLQELFDNSSDAIQIAEENGTLHYINKMAAERLGIEQQQANKYNVGDFELLFKNDVNWRKHIEKLDEEGQMSLEGINIHQKTGEKNPVEVTANTTLIKGKKFVVAISRDISQRKKQEQALKASNQKLESIFNEMSDVVWSVKLPENQIIFVTPSVENLYEIPVEEWLNDFNSWESFILEEDRGVAATIREELAKKGNYSVRYRILTPSGKIKWIRNNGKYIYDNEKIPTRLDCVLMDRTQQYKAQENLQQELLLQEVLIDIATTYINLDLKKLETTIQQSLEKMGRFVAADRAYIFDYDFDSGTTSNTYEWCEEGVSPEIGNLQDVPIDFLPQFVASHVKNEAFYIPRLEDMNDEKDQGLKSILEPQQIKSLITIPMLDEQELIGFVGFDSVKKHHQYSEKEQKLLHLFAQMLINIRSREKSAIQLQVQEEKFRNLIANMKLGLLEMDLAGNIIYANQSFCHMSGYTVTELSNKTATELFYNQGFKEKVNQNDAQVPEGISSNFELKIQNKKGEPKWWFVNRAPNYNDKDQLIGSIAVHLDITQQKHLEQELAKAKSYAEGAAKAKELFLANMSHEIRTPLNVIIGMIRQLTAEKLNSEQLGYVFQAQSSARHLLTILNDILDIAKIESGDLDIVKSEFSPTAMAHNVQSILYSQAKDKFLDFPLDISTRVSPVLIGDEIRLRQVLINLLGNAIKFTEKGQVKLQIDVINETEDSQTLRFQTSDTGIGMSEDFTQKIFEKFSQEQNMANRKFQGTGLGMAISYDLVNLMGSKLVVESQKDKGTKFTFDITFPIGNADKLLHTSAAITSGIFKGKKALLVEDNEMNRFIAIQSLNFLGFITTEAENGKKAIEEVKRESFDLVLMDIQMPVMDGVEATHIIRNELKINTPILALTANAFRHDIDLYLSTGMNDFITKPYDEQDFFRKIELVMGEKASVNTSKENDLPVENTIKEDLPPLYNLSQIESIGRGSAEFVRAMCGLFINLSKESGIEMQQAIEKKDWQSIQKVAHKVKPSIDQFDIILIKETVRDVENYDFTVDSEENFIAKVELIVSTMEKVAAELAKI